MYCRPVCVCGFTEVAPPTFSFHERGGKGGKEKRNLNSNVYFRFELIEKAKREGFYGGRAHCYAEIEKQNA